MGLLLAMGMVLSGCVRSDTTSKIALGEPSPEERRDLYVRLCASCHGADGRGDGPLAAELRVAPTNLTSLAAVSGEGYPRALVADSLTGRRAIRAHGPPEMPVWAERLDPDGSPAAAAAGLYRARLLEALVDHVESLQEPR